MGRLPRAVGESPTNTADPLPSQHAAKAHRSLVRPGNQSESRMTEKIAGTAESESKKAMYQARDARNGALVMVREAIHALCCGDIGDVEYLTVQQELIGLCSGVCDLSHAYHEACERAAEVRAARVSGKRARTP
jgi:hypothetical protein